MSCYLRSDNLVICRSLASVAFVIIAVLTWYRTPQLSAAQSSSRSSTESRAYYSPEQAREGKSLYAQNCAKCHLADLKGHCPGESLSEPAYVCSARGSNPP